MLKPILIGITAAIASAAGLAIAQEMPQPPAPMMRADGNGDGVITRQEFLAQAGERFDRMDANHDGRIDASEMPRFGERRRAMRGDGPPPPPPPPSKP